MSAKSKILILGSSGFIGASLLQSLAKISDFQVKGFNSSTLDLSTPDSSRQLGENVDRDTTVILLVRARKSSDPLESYDKDTVIAGNVARFLTKYPIKRLVFFSSISVYGESATDLNISEKTEIAPSSHYAISRFTTENLLRLAAEKMQTPLVVLRPCMVFGPGNVERAYGPDRFISSMVEKGHIEIFGDGSELRDFLFIGDLVNITKKFIFRDCSGTYNLGTSVSTSFSHIIENLQAITGKDFPVIKIKRVKPKIDQGVNISRFMKFYPDFVFTPFKEGLKQTLDSHLNITKQKTPGTL